MRAGRCASARPRGGFGFPSARSAIRRAAGESKAHLKKESYGSFQQPRWKATRGGERIDEEVSCANCRGSRRCARRLTADKAWKNEGAAETRTGVHVEGRQRRSRPAVRLQRQGVAHKLLGNLVRAMPYRDSLARRVPARLPGPR